MACHLRFVLAGGLVDPKVVREQDRCGWSDAIAQCAASDPRAVESGQCVAQQGRRDISGNLACDDSFGMAMAGHYRRAVCTEVVDPLCDAKRGLYVALAVDFE